MSGNNVYIDGFSSNAFAGMPEWATESTLTSILKTMQDTMKLQDSHFKKLEASLRTFTGSKGGSGSAAGAQDPAKVGLISDQLKESLAFGEEEAKQNKKTKDHWKDTNKQNTLGDKLFGNMTKSAVAFNTAIAGIDYLGAKAVMAMAQNVEGYASLYKSGVGVADASNAASDGFMSLQHLVILAGMRLSDLSAVMTRYANTITVFGANKFVSAVTKANLSLGKFGFTAAEGAEFTGSYLDSIKGFTDTANMSDIAIAKSAAQFGESMRTVSLLTGQSTQELMAKFNELAKTTDASILSTRLGEKATESMTGFLAGLKDQNLAHSIQNMMAAPIKELDSTFAALNSSGEGGIASRFKQVMGTIQEAAENGASPQEQAELFRQFASSVKVSNAEKLNLQLQAASGNTNAQKSLEVIASFERSARDIAALTPAKKAEIEKETQAMNARSKISTQWNRIMGSLAAIFTPTVSSLEWFGNALEHVGNVVESVAKYFEGSIIPTVVTLGTVLFASVATIYKAVSMISSVFGGVGASIASGISTMLSWLWAPFRLFGNILGGGMKIISWLLDGVASLGSAFAWLANPITKLTAAFAAGYEIGTILYGMIKDFQWFQSGMDTLFGWLDHLLQYLPGQIGADAKSRIESKDMVTARENATATATASAIAPVVQSIITTPTPSAVQTQDHVAPYSDKAPEEKEATSSDLQVVSKSPPVAKEPEINSLLKYQNSLLEQLLTKQTDALSTQRDLLKVTRNS